MVMPVKPLSITRLVVIDTCVLVAAARSHNGVSFKLLSMLPSSDFEIALTVPLYTEYQAVLTRPEHLPLGLDVDAALGFVRYLASIALLHDVYFLWRPLLRDPNDDTVLECAVACGSKLILTHNTKDFRRAESLSVSAVTPADFLELIRSQP